ncbi:restriction endonuclease subunit S [Sphingobacterium sp. DR205]|uniref:restriction endonuclease subunit S n=1 Tax=Sphingobacterium sp. DR205 TaxID=2713573 RepID=UPI0013E47EAA|nr:restriction endonuclease subunit S [Sphingobacterium sp. DR205]QIH35508.1 restriction endonuclease subunit S [Sphingobacterium sp. DR205]
MSKIEELIAQYCPDGVEYKKLGEVLHFLNGKGHEKAISDNGNYIVVNSKFISTNGNVKKHSDTQISPLFVDDILMVMSDLPNGRALAKTFIVDNDNLYTLNQRICSLSVKDKSSQLPKYYYYLLNRHLSFLRFDNGVDQTNLRKDDILNVLIPIPPLPVQEEIVNILDKFTALERELEGELEARTRQYEYYRNELLTFEGKEVDWKTLPQISENLNSKRKPVKGGSREKGNIPYYGASGIVDYVKDYIFDGDFLLISEDGANLLTRNTPIAFSITGKSWVNNHAHVLKFKHYATRRLIEYYLNSIDLVPYITGAAQPKLNKQNLNNILVPVPSLEEQERIVTILDKFDALVNDISVGLPAEIAARRQQYEYYRGKLLTFEPLAVAQ